MISHKLLNAAFVIAAIFGCSQGNAAESFLDVGKQAPITILINSSPWYSGFEKVVALYEEQTGNKVNLEVTPYEGMLEKARAAVHGEKSPFDILNLETGWTIEFYAGGFLRPLEVIDPSFKLPDEVYQFGDSGCWDASKNWRTCKTGKLMGYSPNGNIHLLYYRSDFYEKAGLKPPVTFDDVLKNCTALNNPPKVYGYVQQGERGAGQIRYAWMPYMLAYNAKVERDPENGDYFVTINSPEAKAALDKFIEISKKCGPKDAGAALGQGELIQLVQTGKAAQAHAVVAAFPSFDDPQKSAVVGKIAASELPRATPSGNPGVAIGNWVFAVPRNVSDAGAKGAIAFSKWFLTAKAQYAYALGGGIPVRKDTLESDLATQPKYRWMTAYKNNLAYGQQVFGYAESAAVTNVLGLRLNQALIGEMSSSAALNRSAEEIRDIFEKNGRKTGMLPKLPE
jgi:multiple sugar transport system substrate-binding protein